MLLALFWIGCTFARAEIEDAPPIHSELSRLEQKMAKAKIDADERQRLAEIYFLTSRCADAMKLLARTKTKEALNLKCACGGGCAPKSTGAKIQSLKKLLAKHVRWQDARVQKIWHELQDVPEANYLVVKVLRQRRDSRSQSVRVGLESSLESLEVKP